LKHDKRTDGQPAGLMQKTSYVFFVKHSNCSTSQLKHQFYF